MIDCREIHHYVVHLYKILLERLCWNESSFQFYFGDQIVRDLDSIFVIRSFFIVFKLIVRIVRIKELEIWWGWLLYSRSEREECQDCKCVRNQIITKTADEYVIRFSLRLQMRTRWKSRQDIEVRVRVRTKREKRRWFRTLNRLKN